MPVPEGFVYLNSQRIKFETVDQWLTLIQEQGRNLSKWEQDFVDDVADKLRGGRFLTEKQVGIVERIYAEKTW